MNKEYVGFLLAVALGFGVTDAEAAPVTFTTAGVFSTSGTNTATFTDGTGMTTITFNSPVTSTVFTPAGVDFGDFAVRSTEPPGVLGPAFNGSFTLNVTQVMPPGTGSFSDVLSGTLGLDMGVATITFSTTSMVISGFTYTVNPSYTIALPVTRDDGNPPGMTTLQGTITGPAAVPDNGNSLVLLGAALLGLLVVQRRLQSV
jgi:hypothetical protein